MEVVHVAEFETPIGVMRIASTPVGLCYVRLPLEAGRGLAGWLARHAPGARQVEAWAPNRLPAQQILDFLAGKRRDFDLNLDLRATPFQKRVYDEVARIPYGETCSYGEVARRLQRPTAVRAVGAANGANPLPLVIPCHRVVGQRGQLQGYAGGLALKARLLELEARDPRPGRLL